MRVSPTTCSPTGSSTWVLGGRGRVYEFPEIVRVQPDGTRLRTPPAVYGCLFASGRPWRLNFRQPLQSTRNPTFHGARVEPGLSPEATVLNAPWVAYREIFLGVDTGLVFVAARNLRDGKTSRCFAGGFAVPRVPFSVAKIVVQRSGDFVWSSEGLGREIVACDPSGTRTMLDRGPGIDTESLELRGSYITWTNAGVRRFHGPG